MVLNNTNLHLLFPTQAGTYQFTLTVTNLCGVKLNVLLSVF
jgi:hypothetical protein